MLETPELARWARSRYLPTGVDDAVKAIVFGGLTGCWLTAEWPHVLRFTDVITTWVQRVGFHPDAYQYLLLMLDSPGWRCVPEPALDWLHQIIQLSPDARRLWSQHENGARTARLLKRMWDSERDEIRRDGESLRRFSMLVDRLVAAGEPLASVLQGELEALRGA